MPNDTDFQARLFKLLRDHGWEVTDLGKNRFSVVLDDQGVFLSFHLNASMLREHGEIPLNYEFLNLSESSEPLPEPLPEPQAQPEAQAAPGPGETTKAIAAAVEQAVAEAVAESTAEPVAETAVETPAESQSETETEFEPEFEPVFEAESTPPPPAPHPAIPERPFQFNPPPAVEPQSQSSLEVHRPELPSQPPMPKFSLEPEAPVKTQETEELLHEEEVRSETTPSRGFTAGPSNFEPSASTSREMVSTLTLLCPPDSAKNEVRNDPRHRILVGRGLQCDLVIKDPLASREHAVITKEDGNYWITNLKSANGLFLNEKPCERFQLKNGDWIRIGDTSIQIQIELSIR